MKIFCVVPRTAPGALAPATYSSRNVTAGSTLVARLAGIYEAISASGYVYSSY